MSDQRGDYYYDSHGRQTLHRYGTPSGTTSASNSNMGQGQRTVLPPLSSALQTTPSRSPSASNAYYYNQTQPASQPRNDFNMYGQPAYPSNTASQFQTASYGQYPQHEPRPSSQATYSSYQSRLSSSVPPDADSSLRLPPLNIPTSREDRWQTSSYPAASSHYATHQAATAYNPSSHHISHQSTAPIRSPTATYPDPYAHFSYQQPSGYAAPDPHQLPPAISSMASPSRMSNPPPRISVGRGAPARVETHTYNPYNRAPPMIPSTSYIAEPETPVGEPTIKKKRKRADAAQLKVLNEVYARTAFPSTEERQDLARRLDMSARSVQIWFQNKRQAMRQSNRQSSSSQQPSTAQAVIPVPETPTSPTAPYGGSPSPPIPRSAPPHTQGYAARVSPEAASYHGRSPQPTPPSHRRIRSEEESKWRSNY